MACGATASSAGATGSRAVAGADCGVRAEGEVGASRRLRFAGVDPPVLAPVVFGGRVVVRIVLLVPGVCTSSQIQPSPESFARQLNCWSCACVDAGTAANRNPDDKMRAISAQRRRF